MSAVVRRIAARQVNTASNRRQMDSAQLQDLNTKEIASVTNPRKLAGSKISLVVALEQPLADNFQEKVDLRVTLPENTIFNAASFTSKLPKSTTIEIAVNRTGIETNNQKMSLQQHGPAYLTVVGSEQTQDEMQKLAIQFAKKALAQVKDWSNLNPNSAQSGKLYHPKHLH